MIPQNILKYLKDNGLEFERLEHPRAITAQELAAALHVTGHKVAKAVIVEVDQQRMIAMLPASEQVDPYKLGEALGASDIRICGEEEMEQMFPECELGAEPPFGKLFGLPVIVDSSLERADFIVLRAGSHTEAIQLRYEDFARIEQPKVGSFGVPLMAERAAYAEAHP